MEVVKTPDNRLRVKTKPVKKVTPQLLQTISQMIRLTKSFIDPEGVGLAATQIGQGEQYFVAKADKPTIEEFVAVFNPQIIAYSETKKVFFEGCLSIPDYYGEVSRPTSIEVSYLDKNGQIVQKKLTGVDAWIFQHEFDHLQGKLFVDRILEQKSRLFKMTGHDRSGAEIFKEVDLGL